MPTTFQVATRGLVLSQQNLTLHASQTSKHWALCLNICSTLKSQNEQPIPPLHHQHRHAHSKRHVSTAVASATELQSPPERSTTDASTKMDCLPLTTLIRSYLITSISSIPMLLKPSLTAMTVLAHSKSKLLNPDTNPLLHALLKKTFYVQFCAGETPTEVRRAIKDLKNIGFSGVILGHAREVVLSKEQAENLGESINGSEFDEANKIDIERWRNATLDTIELTQEGDYVALKFTGAGQQALQHLKATTPCAPALRDAIHEICALAQKGGVKLLFDAEQASLQQGIDNWTLYYMRNYNTDGKATVFGTYQAYAKRTPRLLAEHLDVGAKEGFVVGVKLVRGAYLGSDPRELFWDTIEGTHKCYDNLAACVMQRKYEGLLKPADSDVTEFPNVELVLASHNAESTRKARSLRDSQTQRNQPKIPMAYGQLMGMADHVSCELVQEARERRETANAVTEIPQAYKYLVWGTMGECMKYLLRRAQENKDAVSRTVDARQALGKEIARRFGFIRG